MKNARPQNSETSALDKRNCIKTNPAFVRFIVVMTHPDLALMVVLVCLLLWGAL